MFLFTLKTLKVYRVSFINGVRFCDNCKIDKIYVIFQRNVSKRMLHHIFIFNVNDIMNKVPLIFMPKIWFCNTLTNF